MNHLFTTAIMLNIIHLTSIGPCYDEDVADVDKYDPIEMWILALQLTEF